MEKKRALKLAEKLNDELEVVFTELGFVYRVFHSELNEGYMVEVLDEDGEEIDGGLCTGNAVDAIEFMLPTKIVVKYYFAYELENIGWRVSGTPYANLDEFFKDTEFSRDRTNVERIDMSRVEEA